MRISKQEEDIKMDDNNSALNHQNGVGLKGQTQIMGGSNMNNKQDNMVGNNEINANQAVNTAQYSIPGVLHFIQHEWARFELERSQWDVDRAELQAKIAALLGERKGQENLKSDLIRRIKMLEYALKQERVKFHRLKYGYDPPMNDMKAPVDETEIMNEVAPDPEVPFSSVSNITWKQGRQLLRQYLQEIGYTETIIDVRSNRVRLILGLNNNQQEQEENINPNVNSNENNKRASETQGEMIIYHHFELGPVTFFP
jgi:striatin 1/3/4